MMLGNRIFGNEKGSVLIETAIVLPVLIALMGGAFELGYFMLANQKADGLAASMADMVSRAESGITESEVNDIFEAIQFIAEPFDIVDDGRVIITSVVGDDDNGNTIVWQRCSGNLTFPSELGREGDDDIDLRGGIVLANGDIAIVAEVVYEYAPRILAGVVDPMRITSQATFRPRFGFLTAVTNDNAPQSRC